MISIHHDEITIKIIEKSTENKPNAENVTFWWMHCEENWRIYEGKIKIFSSV